MGQQGSAGGLQRDRGRYGAGRRVSAVPVRAYATRSRDCLRPRTIERAAQLPVQRVPSAPVREILRDLPGHRARLRKSKSELNLRVLFAFRSLCDECIRAPDRWGNSTGV